MSTRVYILEVLLCLIVVTDRIGKILNVEYQ